MLSNVENFLGSKIKAARENAGLSLEELAKQGCISAKQLEQIESGGDAYFYSAAIKLASAKKIAKLLGVVEDGY
jgi:transcriptional regulator with XRE-family HTH domain